MLTPPELSAARRRTAATLRQAGIVLTDAEQAHIEVTDVGLGRFAQIGLSLVVYINTERCCSKELVLLPRQNFPEHRHPPLPQFSDPGKEETFRCRWGTVYLYVAGTPAAKARVKPPADRAAHYTVWHEVILKPGMQYTIAPDTLHWFQAGAQGAIVSEFSTRSRDEFDIFTDPDIRRVG